MAHHWNLASRKIISFQDGLIIFILRNFDSKSWYKWYRFSLNCTEWQKLTRFGFHSWTSSFSQNFSAISLLPVPWSQPCLHLRLTWELLKRMDVKAGLPPTPIKLKFLLMRPGIKYYKAFWVILMSGQCWEWLLPKGAPLPSHAVSCPMLPHLSVWSSCLPEHPFCSGSCVFITPIFQNLVQMLFLSLTCFQMLCDVKVTQLCLTLQPHGLYSAWNSPDQNTRVGSISLLSGIFPTQESNPSLLQSRQILYQLSYKGSPLNALGPK